MKRFKLARAYRPDTSYHIKIWKTEINEDEDEDRERNNTRNSYL
jgi:hypothetical protein